MRGNITVFGLLGSVVLVVGLLLIPAQAHHCKGPHAGDPGCGGTTYPNLGRIELLAPTSLGNAALLSDGVSCEEYDYWDQRDSALVGQGGMCREGNMVSITSGGRVKWFTTIRGRESNSAQPLDEEGGISERYVVLAFTGTSCLNLDQRIYEAFGDTLGLPPVNDDPCIDNVDIQTSWDRVFKPGAERQPDVSWTLPVCVFCENPNECVFLCYPTPYKIQWRKALYITPDPDAQNNPDIRILKTGDGEGEAIADVVEKTGGGPKDPGTVLATVEFPLKIRITQIQP